MYSIVMLMAVSTAPEAVEFGGRGGFGGFHNSCYGGSCCGGFAYGSCYGSCYGSSCSGGFAYGSCSGSSCDGGFAYGSCHGHRYAHNYSSCYGSSCHGSHFSSGCCGGSCYGSYSYSSCLGYGIYGGVSPSHSAYPISVGSGCYGYGMPQYITPNINAVPGIMPPSMSPTIGLKPTDDKAVVAVRLPADATLYADGQKTQLTSAERVFLTPSLASGQRYQYELKVEYTREGKPVVESKKVFVKAGERTDVEFVDAKLKTATRASEVTVIVPSDAKLLVDQKPSDLTGTRREFRTPELPLGQQFSYQFRAEVVRNGKTEAQTQVVTFRAGEPIKVDFSDLDTVRTASK